MITLSPEISDAERAVQNYKHEQMVRVMAAILRLALVKPFVSPGDIDPDLVPEESRQGILSNSWNSLTSLEIIERLPMGYTDPANNIYGGRIQNTNESSKGRWVGCYRLRSAALARTWLLRNKQVTPPPSPETGEQLQFV